MPQFFIHRPVFAWVIALFIVLAGVIAIPKLPISRYPSVAPVSVTLYATYPGATPQTLNDAVVSLIERELMNDFSVEIERVLGEVGSLLSEIRSALATLELESP